ncbi:hypothetical protein Cni_G20526 [Canna indica]|uniref:Uncharacterized protein n=1 Tax=Canna indica TaxID=4628 RepID=A0AAQ3KU06_9LILI|nr:hypothetical protein Cni_G20526 [Canna indica]
MASLKAVRPAGIAQSKEPAKVGEGASTKVPVAKQPSKKSEQKPREPRKKGRSSKPSAKN